MILITNDLFDIANRLRSVNDSYRLYYNTGKCRYEVHDDSGNLQFVVPYDELDARTVEYARYTSVQNAKAIFQEIEESNARAEKEHLDSLIENAMANIEKGG